MKWSQVPWGEGWAAGGPWGWKLFLWKEKDILRGGTVTTQRNLQTPGKALSKNISLRRMSHRRVFIVLGM